jgi:iron complex transport system permease protein
MTQTQEGLDLAAGWRRRRHRQQAAYGIAILMLFAAFLASLDLGVVALSPWQTLSALFPSLFPASWKAAMSAGQVAIVQDLRLPRALMATIAGGGLSLAGTAMQGITRNVLVSPFTVGISPAAAFGASLAILFGSASAIHLGPYLIIGSAFTSAMICAAFVLILSSLRGVSATMLVLCGVAFTYLFGALTATIQFISSEQQLVTIVHWTFGSVNGTTWPEVRIAGFALLITAPPILLHATALNAFATGGDEIAASLGFPVAHTRLIITLAVVFLTAAIVSFVGVIGFVGLVAPHIARLIVQGDNKVLLPFSILTGALLVLVADLIGRLVFAPVVIPVGIVVAYLGVPIFLQLLISRRQEWGD